MTFLRSINPDIDLTSTL